MENEDNYTRYRHLAFEDQEEFRLVLPLKLKCEIVAGWDCILSLSKEHRTLNPIRDSRTGY